MYFWDMKREVIETADGSNTIFISEMNENYHSGHGALQEALHVFISNGLGALNDKKEISIFEVGFGTGLNAILSLIHADNNDQIIHYSGIEAFPVEKELIDQIGYEKLVDAKYKEPFYEMHSLTWETIHKLKPNFSFQKIHQKIENFQVTPNSIDILFFDAFGPRAQSEMWDIGILEKMYTMLKPEGFFVTYCAKGQVKRDLKSLGFKVEALAGPPGKREMTRAMK